MSPSLPPSEYELLASLRYGLCRFLNFSREAARAAGLAPQQHQALLAIKGFPGGGRPSVGEVAERLQLRHHSAVGLVDRLTRRQLVRRIPSGTDRRRIEVELTARGSALVARLAAVHLRELRELGPELHRLLGAVIRPEAAGAARGRKRAGRMPGVKSRSKRPIR